MCQVLVVGFGNRMMGDDGAGPAVIAAIRRRGCSRAHRIEDGGADVLTLPALWRREPEVWIVDAVQASLPAGTIHRLDNSELLSLPQRTASCHHLSLPECLSWIRLGFPEMGRVRYRLWGIEPANLDARDILSPAVSRSVSVVADELLRELVGRPEICD